MKDLIVSEGIQGGKRVSNPMPDIQLLSLGSHSNTKESRDISQSNNDVKREVRTL